MQAVRAASTQVCHARHVRHPPKHPHHACGSGGTRHALRLRTLYESCAPLCSCGMPGACRAPDGCWPPALKAAPAAPRLCSHAPHAAAACEPGLAAAHARAHPAAGEPARAARAARARRAARTALPAVAILYGCAHGVHAGRCSRGVHVTHRLRARAAPRSVLPAGAERATLRRSAAGVQGCGAGALCCGCALQQPSEAASAY